MQTIAQRQPPPRLCPSLAPAPSYASVKTRFALSQHPNDIQVYANNVHPKQHKGWFDNGVCVISPYHRGTFRQGDVVSVPFHISNTNPNVDKYQKEIQITAQGPVYSKRRMFIVLFKAREAMFCLPLYSWQQVGIEKKDDGRGLIDDHVCVVNYKDRVEFETSGKVTGPHRPLFFVHRHENSVGLTESTTCQLVGGQWISYNEDIGKVGRITESSYDQMLLAWNERCKACWRDKDPFPVEGEQDYRFVKLNAPPSRIGGQSQAPSRRSQDPYHSQAPSGYSQTPSRPSYASSRNSHAASRGSMAGSNWRRGKTDHWSPGQPY
ncbi:hypothetical protein CB0940_00244 [Cercospora beticola]|uniref:DUF6590 domain-containing protein n=1 Tax=Cercospora beticola TaxID=122368 RepID=A0A2G5I8E1_CERBT|nr:hypothetical protein CB0940_00244 [Cercospora beticola]PIB01055.1 hypothetical protein CB0940_00244 [Cercospora beticola]WPA95652.1 hypothetical protein RHO25_000255 [Cercospora beticola]